MIRKARQASTFFKQSAFCYLYKEIAQVPQEQAPEPITTVNRRYLFVFFSKFLNKVYNRRLGKFLFKFDKQKRKRNTSKKQTLRGLLMANPNVATCRLVLFAALSLVFLEGFLDT